MSQLLRILPYFQALRNFPSEDRGAASIEYSLIAGLIAMAIVTVISAISSDVRALYESVAAAFTG
jgi:pilus assembly protein Flp/PilA